MKNSSKYKFYILLKPYIKQVLVDYKLENMSIDSNASKVKLQNIFFKLITIKDKLRAAVDNIKLSVDTNNLLEQISLLYKQYTIKTSKNKHNGNVILTIPLGAFTLEDDDGDEWDMGEYMQQFEFTKTQIIPSIEHTGDFASGFSEGVSHPHVSGGQICGGQMQEALNKCLIAGNLFDYTMLIVELLSTYNSNSAFAQLSTCYCDCGAIQTSDDINSCTACGNCICPSCEYQCPCCCEYFCESCIYTCDHCSNQACNSCMNSCSDCGGNICEACLESCDSCDTTICESCAQKCYNCGNMLCYHCQAECPGCENVFCKNCLFTCEQCGADVCDDCVIKCPICEKYICKNECFTCKECKRLVCNSHDEDGVCDECTANSSEK